MTTPERRVAYRHGDTDLEGVLVGDVDDGAVVLVFPGWEGRTDGVIEVAAMLAAMGYPGFAADLYGTGVTGTSPEQCDRLMAPFMADRAFLGDRLDHVVDAVRAIDGVDPDRLFAVGFCFGGLCVLDLARRNAGLVGVASFHGVLTPPPITDSTDIEAAVLVLHGWDDPLAPPADVTRLGAELTARRADWQLHAFGSTMHAFMVPGADDPAAGVRYNARSAARAWDHFTRFVESCLARR